MKAIELTGTVDDRGNLSLDDPVLESANSRVRVIILSINKALMNPYYEKLSPNHILSQIVS